MIMLRLLYYTKLCYASFSFSFRFFLKHVSFESILYLIGILSLSYLFNPFFPLPYLIFSITGGQITYLIFLDLKNKHWCVYSTTAAVVKNFIFSAKALLVKLNCKFVLLVLLMGVFVYYISLIKTIKWWNWKRRTSCMNVLPPFKTICSTRRCIDAKWLKLNLNQCFVIFKKQCEQQ